MNAWGCVPDAEQTWTRLWGKTCPDDAYHPLIWHMLDVAAVAALLWDHHLDSRLRNRLVGALDSRNPRGLMVFLAGAHEIGKVNPWFQEYLKAVAEARPARSTPHSFWDSGLLHQTPRGEGHDNGWTDPAPPVMDTIHDCARSRPGLSFWESRQTVIGTRLLRGGRP